MILCTFLLIVADALLPYYQRTSGNDIEPKIRPKTQGTYKGKLLYFHRNVSDLKSFEVTKF